MFEQAHKQACSLGLDTYQDPATGYTVMTRLALLKQGSCCGNGCRHCPYGHMAVSNPAWRSAVQTEPALLYPLAMIEPELDVMFWSGGKDSLLALMRLKDQKRQVVLLTTFDPVARTVPIQHIDIQTIAQQAQWLGLPLCLVPVSAEVDHVQQVQAGLACIERSTGAFVSRLVFGDLHLQDLRAWRTQHFADHEVYTPLFDCPYLQLLTELWSLQKRLGFEVQITRDLNVGDRLVPAGSTYSPTLVEALQAAGLDAMLERGEGHTVVVPPRL